MNTLSLWFESLPKSLLLFSGKVLSPAFHELSPGQHPEGMRHYWNHQRTTGQAEFGNESISHSHFGPQKQRKTIMKKVQQRFSLHSQGNLTSISKFIPWHDSAPGISQLLSLPFVTDAARLENAEVWIRWSWDCTTENINVNIILGFASLQLKYSTNPFFFPPSVLSWGFFLFCSFIKAHTIKYVQREVRNIWKHLKKSKYET